MNELGRSKNLIGMKFGKLKVFQFLYKDKRYDTYWYCQCKCGNEKIVQGHNLVNKFTKSCGCLHKGAKITHGLSETRFYHVYKGIKQRCFDKNCTTYERYGDRGIKCYWDNFEEFKEDMYDSYLEHIKKYGKKDTTIDRIDNDKGYFKNNCQWSTRFEQAQNRRNTVKVKYNEEILTIRALRKKLNLNISCSMLRYRIYEGWLIEDIINNYNTKRRSWSKHELHGFQSWKDVCDYLGVSRQRVFQRIGGGETTLEIILNYTIYVKKIS